VKALPELFLEEMSTEDIDEIIEIEKSSFPTPWPRQMFEMELKSPRSFSRVARISGVL